MATFDFFTPLNQIGRNVANQWEESERKQTLADLGSRLSGSSPQYGDAAALAFANGDASLGLGLLGLSEKARERQAGDAASTEAARMLNGGGVAQPAYRPPVSVTPRSQSGAGPSPMRTAGLIDVDGGAAQMPGLAGFLVNPSDQGPQHSISGVEQYDRMKGALDARAAQMRGDAGPPLPPAAPVRTAAAPAAPSPADVPAPNAAEVEFVIPGTNERVTGPNASQIRTLTGILSMRNLPERDRQNYSKMRDDLLQTAREEAREGRKAAQDRQTPVMDPAERRALGIPDNYQGPVMRDGLGRITAPLKPATEIKNEGTIPPGYRAIRDKTGNVERLELIPGGEPAKKADEAAKKDALTKQRMNMSGGVVLDSIGDIDRIMKEATLPTTGALGSRVAAIKGTAAHDIANALTTIGANISFDNLNQMRQASPTGGALGAVSDKEGELLRSAYGALQQSQSEQQFRTNLGRLRSRYETIVHGKTLTNQERRAGGPMTEERANDLRSEAAAAIAAGAPRAQVLRRLGEQYGLGGNGL